VILIDSNVLIDSARIEHKWLRIWLASKTWVISGATYVEVFGYHKMGVIEKAYFSKVIKDLRILDLDRNVLDRAVDLRQIRKMNLGDALIAATALIHQIPLATRNTTDFARLEGLELIDPFELTTAMNEASNPEPSTPPTAESVPPAEESEL
jgi:toxin FitB